MARLIDTRGSSKRRPVELAACEGKIEALGALLKFAKDSIAADDNDVKTPAIKKTLRQSLQWACWGGQPDAIKLLLSEKASIGILDVNFNRGTPFYWAASAVLSNIGFDALDVLLKYCTNQLSIDPKDPGGFHGDVLLKGAIDAGAPLFIRGLLTRFRINFESNLIDYAISLGKQAVVSVLLEHIASTGEHQDHDRRLLCAVIDRDIQKATALIEEGARPSRTLKARKDKLTVLHLASLNGDSLILKLLLQHNHERAFINDVSSGGETALHIACRFGHTDIAIILLQDGADYLLKTPDGYMAHHLLVMSDAVEGQQLRKTLDELESEKILEDPTTEGKTALFIALSRNNTELSEVLIDAEADPKSIDRSTSFTVLHEKAHLEYLQEAVEFILEKDLSALDAGADKYIGTPLEHVISAGSIELVNKFMEYRDSAQINLDKPDAHGWSPRQRLFLSNDRTMRSLELPSLLENCPIKAGQPELAQQPHMPDIPEQNFSFRVWDSILNKLTGNSGKWPGLLVCQSNLVSEHPATLFERNDGRPRYIFFHVQKLTRASDRKKKF